MPDSSALPINPHFDHGRVVWTDAYSRQYEPIAYNEQFDDQWRLFLEGKIGFRDHTGVETSDDYIDDRINELTGVANYLTSKTGAAKDVAKDRDIGGRLYLEPKFPIDFFQGKHCLDLGCGAGRWTRTLQALGARVKSTDVSAHGLASVRRFNEDAEALNLFDILQHRPDLHSAFDFTICWGVIMCTHDPQLAFANAAATVKPGGYLYIMVYAPTYHNSLFVTENRKRFHGVARTFEEKLLYAYQISTDARDTINQLDMLNTFYNWAIPESVAHDWYRDNGFKDIVTLNAKEVNSCGWHVLGRKV